MQHENEELYQRIQTDLLYFILVADIVIAEMTNKFTRTTLKTLDYLNNSSLESNDDSRSDHQNVIHYYRQQSSFFKDCLRPNDYTTPTIN